MSSGFVYSFSYLKGDGTMLCQLMQTDKDTAIKVLNAYATTFKQISEDDLQECVSLIRRVEYIGEAYQETYCGKTLSVCMQAARK